MSLASQMTALVTRLTKPSKFGATGITLTVPAATEEFDEETGDVVVPEPPEGEDPDAPVTYQIQAIDTRYSEYMINKDTIDRNSLRLTVAIFEIDPPIGAIVNLNGRNYTVVDVSKLSVQGQSIGWQLMLDI